MNISYPQMPHVHNINRGHVRRSVEVLQINNVIRTGHATWLLGN